MSDLFMNSLPTSHRQQQQQQQHQRWLTHSTAPGTAASCTPSSCSGTSTVSTDRHRMHNGTSAKTATTTATTNDRYDKNHTPKGGNDYGNLLSLQLRKPKNWKWELTTSRSCTNIALPRILLYNHKGELLVDAHGMQEQCIRQDDVIPPSAQSQRRSRSDTRSVEKSPMRDVSISPSLLSSQRLGRAATTDLARSIRKALDRQLSGLHIQEATPSPTHTHTRNSVHTMSPQSLNSPIDFYTNDLPDYALERRSSSLKGVRFHHMTNGDGKIRMMKRSPQSNYPLSDLPTPPSTLTPTTTTTASSTSGTREKRRYRRSQSSGGHSPAKSRSILERMSYSRGRFSSPDTETAEEYEVPKVPRYFLRTSKAGTLMLREESFTQYRRRRRKPKSSSSENLPNEEKKSRSSSSNFLRVGDESWTEGGSLHDISELPERQRGRTAPIRRYRSDGNVLLHKLTPSSSEVEEEDDCHNCKSKRDELPTIDSGNEIATAWDKPTR